MTCHITCTAVRVSTWNANVLSAITSQPQIGCLLKAIDLPEYEERFLKNHINGQVLLELTLKVLEDDLDIDSRLHRIRIMNLVAGKVSKEKLAVLK